MKGSGGIMKKSIGLFLVCIIAFNLVGFSYLNSPAKSIYFNYRYFNPIGFSKVQNSEVNYPPEKNIYVFDNKKEWNIFTDKYLKSLKSVKINFTSKKVICLLLDWPEKLSGPTYIINDITVSNKKINVYVENNGTLNVSPINSSIYFKYILAIDIDKKDAPKDFKPNLIIIKELMKNYTDKE
jgi:hypothetical protein